MFGEEAVTEQVKSIPPAIEELLSQPHEIDEAFAALSGVTQAIEDEKRRVDANAKALQTLQTIDEHLSKKRYHQFFCNCETYLFDPETSQQIWTDPRQRMYFALAVIKPSMMKLNSTQLLVLLRRVADTVRQIPAVKFLSFWLPSILESTSGLLLYKSIIALHLLEAGYAQLVDELLFENVQPAMDACFGLPSEVEAEFHKAAAAYYWHVVDYDHFYSHAMFYLQGRDPGRVTREDDIQLAKQLCRAVLLSPKIYSFTELLQHPILLPISPGGSAYATDSLLRDLVVMSNSGDLVMFEAFLAERQKQIADEDLASSLPLLISKITIFALLEAAFVKPQKARQLTFAEIAATCRVDPSEVERLVMKIMSHGLLTGAIDEVSRTLTFSSLQPRLLDDHKIRAMAEQFQSWSVQISSLVSSMEKMAPELQRVSGVML